MPGLCLAFQCLSSLTFQTIMRGQYLCPHFADMKGNNSAQCGPLTSCCLSPASEGQTMRLREVKTLAQGHQLPLREQDLISGPAPKPVCGQAFGNCSPGSKGGSMSRPQTASTCLVGGKFGGRALVVEVTRRNTILRGDGGGRRARRDQGCRDRRATSSD